MKKKTLHKIILIASLLTGNIFLCAPTQAAICNAYGNQGSAGCPTVQSLQSNGSAVTVNWAWDAAAQTFASLSGTRASTWGLYMIYDWTTSMNGHWFGGGTKVPVLTVNNTDLPLRNDGTSTPDACSNNAFYCTHDMMAARFYKKYGFSGSVSVSPPSSGKPCLIFGAINPSTSDFYTVFSYSLAEPCQPGYPGTVEPDPEWCGMSTSALSFDFGDMAPTAVAGSSLSKTAVMDCSKAGVTYNLYLSNVTTTGRNKIDLGRGITATVSANNQALQTNRTSTGTTNSLNVTVTLSGTPTSTGAISGTGILAVNYL